MFYSVRVVGRTPPQPHQQNEAKQQPDGLIECPAPQWWYGEANDLRDAAIRGIGYARMLGLRATFAGVFEGLISPDTKEDPAEVFLVDGCSGSPHTAEEACSRENTGDNQNNG